MAFMNKFAHPTILRPKGRGIKPQGIQLLDIDFKKESDRYGRVLFNTNKKRDFELKDV